MALQKTWGNPYSTDPATQAYFRIAETNLNHAQQCGRVVVAIYLNRAARDADLPPIGGIGYDFAEATPAAGTDPTTGQPNFVFPGYVDLMALINAIVPSQGQGLYDAIKAALYGIISQDPVLAGASSV